LAGVQLGDGCESISAVSHKQLYNLHMTGVLCFRWWIAPAVKRPAERGGSVSPIFHVKRRLSLQQETDDFGMPAIGCPMQACFSVTLRRQIHSRAGQEIDHVALAIFTRPQKAGFQLPLRRAVPERAILAEVSFHHIEATGASCPLQVKLCA